MNTQWKSELQDLLKKLETVVDNTLSEWKEAMDKQKSATIMKYWEDAQALYNKGMKEVEKSAWDNNDTMLHAWKQVIHKMRKLWYDIKEEF